MPRTFKELVLLLVDIITMGLVPIILGLATVAFLWGVASYLLKADSAADRAKGRKFIFYGVIGLFIGLSVWSIVAIFLDVIGVQAVVPQIR